MPSPTSVEASYTNIPKFLQNLQLSDVNQDRDALYSPCMLLSGSNHYCVDEYASQTFATSPEQVRERLKQRPCQVMVIEACLLSGWVHDICKECGVDIVVANPHSEAWRWKNVKRKTDRDDALKLARLYQLGEITHGF